MDLAVLISVKAETFHISAHNGLEQKTGHHLYHIGSWISPVFFLLYK